MASPQADEEIVAVLDEETLALMGVSNAATAARVAVGAEWETFKENVRPLKRGRDVSKLNHALAQGTRQSLPAHRSRRSPQVRCLLHPFAQRSGLEGSLSVCSLP
jgi:hypothetical protein